MSVGKKRNCNGKYVVVTNKNTRDEDGYLFPEYLLYMGASTNRGLTGQGLGFKYAVATALLRGLEVARASTDNEGIYIATFEPEEVKIGRDMKERVNMRLKRPGKDDEVIPTTVLTDIADNSWARSSMGNDYPLLREPVLDAADEDSQFVVDCCDEIKYAPIGHTATYLEATPELLKVVQEFWYYYKRSSDLMWLNDRVAVSAASSDDEHRLFLTAAGAPISYVAYTTDNGYDEKYDKGSQAELETAFDYTLAELKDDTLASVPKRLVEDHHRCMDMIKDGIMECGKPELIAKVFRNIANGGYEASMSWSSASWYWAGGADTVREAFKLAFNNLPVCETSKSFEALEADRRGVRYRAVGEKLYNLAESMQYKTLFTTLNLKPKDDWNTSDMTAEDRRTLSAAIKHLNTTLYDGDWKRGHRFVAVKKEGCLGVHYADDGVDYIGLNFVLLSMKQEPTVSTAHTLLHELAHHVERTNSKSFDFDGPDHSEACIDLALGRA